MTCGFESAPIALPDQKHGCGGAENEKAPANAETQIGFEALYSTHNTSGLQGQQVIRIEGRFVSAIDGGEGLKTLVDQLAILLRHYP